MAEGKAGSGEVSAEPPRWLLHRRICTLHTLLHHRRQVSCSLPRQSPEERAPWKCEHLQQGTDIVREECTPPQQKHQPANTRPTSPPTRRSTNPQHCTHSDTRWAPQKVTLGVFCLPGQGEGSKVRMISRNPAPRGWPDQVSIKTLTLLSERNRFQGRLVHRKRVYCRCHHDWG